MRLFACAAVECRSDRKFERACCLPIWELDGRRTQNVNVPQGAAFPLGVPGRSLLKPRPPRIMEIEMQRCKAVSIPPQAVLPSLRLTENGCDPTKPSRKRSGWRKGCLVSSPFGLWQLPPARRHKFPLSRLPQAEPVTVSAHRRPFPCQRQEPLPTLVTSSRTPIREPILSPAHRPPLDANAGAVPRLAPSQTGKMAE